MFKDKEPFKCEGNECPKKLKTEYPIVIEVLVSPKKELYVNLIEPRYVGACGKFCESGVPDKDSMSEKSAYWTPVTATSLSHFKFPTSSSHW